MTSHYDFDRVDPWDVDIESSQAEVSGLLSSQNRLLEGQQSQIFELQARVSELENICRGLTRQLPVSKLRGAIHLVTEAGDDASVLEIPHAHTKPPVDLTVYRCRNLNKAKHKNEDRERGVNR